MPRPPSPMQQRSLAQVTTWDKVRSIDAIVEEAEAGLFYSPALLVDLCLRDDRVSGVLNARINGLLGKPVTFTPAKDTAKGRKIAEDVEAEWPRMFDHSALTELLTWGLTLGVGVGQLAWDRSRGPWIPRLEVWHPSALRWDQTSRTYIAQTTDGESTVTPGDGRWVLFTPFGYAWPGRRGLIRSLARLFLFRQWTLRDWARYSEVHGMPIRVGIMPGTGDKDADEAFAKSLAKLGAETSITVREGEEGNRYGLRLVEAVGKSHESFAGQLAMLDRAIAVRVLGQSQSTDGQAGLGSNAQAGEPVRADIMRADGVALSAWAESQVLRPYCRFEWGAPDLTPCPTWDVDPPEDSAKKALELSTLGDALDKLEKHGVDVRKVLEEAGVPMLSPAQAEAKKAEAEQQAAPTDEDDPISDDSEDENLNA